MHVNAERPVITCSLVPEEERLDFLPEMVGRHFFMFENEVYAWMDILVPSYQGGFWDFYRLSNGGFYMALNAGDLEVKVDVISPNGAERKLTYEVASICVVLFALSHLSLQYPDNERLIDGFHKLREYIFENLEHQDRRDIFSIVD